MILFLTNYLQQFGISLTVFDYLSVRTIMAALTSLFICIFFGRKVITLLKNNDYGENIRIDGPPHFHKSDTPTMGGLFIIIAMTLSIVFWGDWSNRFLPVVVATLLSFGIIGFIDDYFKIHSAERKGLKVWTKYTLQSVVTVFLMYYLWSIHESAVESQFFVPFWKDIAIDLHPLVYMLIGYFVIISSSNAVNLTDGLDGLAIMPTAIIGGALGLIAYLSGNVIFANYLLIPFVPDSGEMVVFCFAIVGAGLGFLWFNAYPAQVFMGDIGALSLGATLGMIAIITRSEVVFFIMAGIFVIETLSVIIQVVSFKLTGKRVFSMAPLHHHYELKGWPEPRVIVRFWIITFILVMLALATLKFR